jgi:hypothetical protein
MIAGSVIWLLPTGKLINNFPISEVPKHSRLPAFILTFKQLPLVKSYPIKYLPL